MTVFKSVNPYTLQTVGQYHSDNQQQVETKIKLAQKTQTDWADLSFEQRSVYFLQLADYLRTNKQWIAELITAEMGKILPEASIEVERCVKQCVHYASDTAVFLKTDIVPTDARLSAVSYEPVGVVLGIMPWNFPIWQVLRYAVPAIMAGNVTLLKHAPNVLGCALVIEQAFLKSGFPAGVFQVIITDTDAIPRILADDRVGMVTLTGSERAGASVAAIAGANIKKSVLELGGSDALIVLPDADLAAAAAVAVQSRMRNAGQACIAAKRFLVDVAVKKEFTERVFELIKNYKQGDPTAADTQIGPLARLDLAQNLERQLSQSIQQGARLLTGGQRQACNFQPTLIDNVTPDNVAFQEETFGPLAVVTQTKNEQQAIEYANQSRFGLSASIWTADLDKAQRFAKKLAVGSVFVNAIVQSNTRLPIGGVKKSGYGRELAEEGIKEFCNTKTLYVR